MFPATKSVSLRRPDVFDPLDDCVALPAQKKKKGTRIKPINIKVFVLPGNGSSSTVPTGEKRQKLVEERRVEMIELKRTLSAAEVEDRIKRGFSHLHLGKWEYMEVVNGRNLIKASTQNPGGEIVDRRGALYIVEKSEECQVCCYCEYEHA